eukprot:505456_1
MILNCITFALIVSEIISVNTLNKPWDLRNRLYNEPIGNNNMGYTALSPNMTISILTRDNIGLATDIYLPINYDNTKTYSVVYEKTPYGKGGLSGDAAQMTQLGYIYIGQDCRGRFDSNGSYSYWRTSGNDTIDTIQYITNQKWSNSLIGVQGVSADAIAHYVDYSGGIISTNYNTLLNNIKVGILIVGDSIMYQTTYQNGAFRTALIEGWLTVNKEAQYVNTLYQNEDFTQHPSYWIPIAGQYKNNWNIFNLSMLHFAGWYDIFSTRQIQTALAINQSGNIGARGQQILIINPGGHCGQGAIDWPNSTWILDYVVDDLIPELYAAAFNASLNGKEFNIHNVINYNLLFYMLGPGGHGENGNFWVQAESMPPIMNHKVYYLDANDMLSDSLPKAGSVSYTYNPLNPVNTYGGNNLLLQPCGPQPQIKNENGRKDIMHFTSGKLEEDIAIFGMISVELYVMSTCPDTDFTAKLIDIFPDRDNTPMLVQDGILRMRWRDGYYKARADNMINTQVYNISIDIGYMSYIFNKGHKISLSISSSNFERFSINWNSGNDVINGSTGMKVAINTIGFGMGFPSKLMLPVVDLDWINQRKLNMEEVTKH